MMNDECRSNGWKRHFWGAAAAVCLAIAGQTLAATWWAATLTTRMHHVEKDLDRVCQRVHTLETGKQ